MGGLLVPPTHWRKNPTLPTLSRRRSIASRSGPLGCAPRRYEYGVSFPNSFVDVDDGAHSTTKVHHKTVSPLT